MRSKNIGIHFAFEKHQPTQAKEFTNVNRTISTVQIEYQFEYRTQQKKKQI